MSTLWQCRTILPYDSMPLTSEGAHWHQHICYRKKKNCLRRIQMFHSEPITNMYGVLVSFKCARLVLPLRAASSSRVLPRALVCIELLGRRLQSDMTS